MLTHMDKMSSSSSFFFLGGGTKIILQHVILSPFSTLEFLRNFFYRFVAIYIILRRFFSPIFPLILRKHSQC